MAFKFQFTLRRVMILTAILAVVGIGRWIYLNLDEYHITTFDCGARRKIIITAASSWEKSQALYYRVVVDDETLVPKCIFSSAFPGESLRFSLVTAENGELAGVVFARRSDASGVVVLHDFGTGESWPAQFEGVPDDSQLKRLHSAFDRLQAENPGVQLSVSD